MITLIHRNNTYCDIESVGEVRRKHGSSEWVSLDQIPFDQKVLL